MMDLSELSLNNIGDWPKKFKLVFLVVLFAVVVFLGYWFDNSSQLKKLNILTQQEKNLKVNFQTKYQEFAQFQTLKKDAKINAEFLKKVATNVPISDQIQDFLEDATKTAAKEKVTIKSLKPSPSIKKNFYVEAPIHMHVVGNYHALANFLSAVAQANSSVAFDDFQLASDYNEGDDIAPAKERLQLRLTAIIFHYQYEGGDEV